jgi:cyclohexyl-isocyanide hydratase
MLDDAYLEDLRRLAEPAQWVGSVCTGAFILAAAGGILDGHRVTTYWSQLDNLALFPELTVDTTSYPRALIDGRRFTGGGISSSLDLALRLVDDIKGKEVCETVQLAIQYNPEPPYDSGDPSTAPAAIVAAQRRAQQGFIELIRQTTEEVLSRRP